MKYLGLDTSNKFVIISLMDNNEVIYHNKLEVYRNASEITNYQIDLAFIEVNWKPSDLDGVIVTRGPGSFTGIRIGISIAKVISTTLNIPLYSINSMNYYAGLNDLAVVLDARSNKAYYGKYKGGKTIIEGMYSIDQVNEFKDENIIGELSIFDLKDNFLNLKDNFLLLKKFWRNESSLDAKPDYYKSNLWKLERLMLKI